MDDVQILEAVERYIREEMNPAEREYFEQLRHSDPEIDQLVVEHTIFLQQLSQTGLPFFMKRGATAISANFSRFSIPVPTSRAFGLKAPQTDTLSPGYNFLTHVLRFLVSSNTAQSMVIPFPVVIPKKT